MSDTVVIQQHRARHFTILGNEVIRDRRLSYRARGLHHVLLSLAEGYQLRVSWLVDHGTDGRHSVLSGLKELQRYGYLKIRRERGHRGRFFRTIWVVTDTPELPGHPPESEFRTEEIENDQEPIVGNAVNQTAKTEEPSVSTTTTYKSVEGVDQTLVHPSQLGEHDRRAVVRYLRDIPIADAQVLLDELAAALERPGVIKKTPVGYFYGLVQKYLSGQFNPVGAHVVAARRIKPVTQPKIQRKPADPKVAQAHIEKIAAALRVTIKSTGSAP